MNPGRPNNGAAGFVFAQADKTTTPPKTILEMTTPDFRLVKYLDEAGKEQVRLAFYVKEIDAVFMFNEMVSGKYVATTANKWFADQMKKRLKTAEIEVAGLAQVGEGT